MNPQILIDTLTTLISLGEEGRLDRSEDRPCQGVSFDRMNFHGWCRGEDGVVVHRPRITVLEGRRSFGCTCQDHQKQRGAKGPCKHVLSLAKMALTQARLLKALSDA